VAKGLIVAPAGQGDLNNVCIEIVIRDLPPVPQSATTSIPVQSIAALPVSVVSIWFVKTEM